ncbi:MAG: glycosyltransferase family protein [Anaerolineae bacterium]
MTHRTAWVGQDELGRASSMVIPAYFSARPGDDMVRDLLWMTLADCAHYMPFENVWVVVDGDERTARLVTETVRDLGQWNSGVPNVLALPENRGKLWAIRVGVQAILRQRPEVAYIVTRDGDGDHAVADMPALLRAAQGLTAQGDEASVLVIGSRSSRHRPMGWIRGELERLLDRVTLDALAFHLARADRVVDLSQCLAKDGVPDLSSGYKVYSRALAELLFLEQAPCYASLAQMDYWHYGPETIPVVEALLADARIAEVPRPTWNGQPTSSFGDMAHTALYGELLAWVYCRLDIPLHAAARLFDNAVPTLLLQTTVEGNDSLAAVRARALERLRVYRREMGPIEPAAPATAVN